MASVETEPGVLPRNVILRTALLFFVLSPVFAGIMAEIYFSVLMWYQFSKVPLYLWRANVLFGSLVASYFAGAIPAGVAGGIVAKFRGYWKARLAGHLFAMLAGSTCFVVFNILVDRTWKFAPNISSAILDLTLSALGALICSLSVSRLSWYHRQ